MGLMGKAKDFLNSESGKQKTSKFLGKAEQAATKRLGADKAGKISRVRKVVEDRLGTNNPGPGGPGTGGVSRGGAAEREDIERPGAAGGEGNPRP